MATKKIKQKLELVSEQVVLCDTSDLQALAHLHTHFEEIAHWADKSSTKEVAVAANAVAGLIENIILDECEDPAHTLEIIGAAVSAIQQVVRDGKSCDQVEFPKELFGTCAGDPRDGESEAEEVSSDQPAGPKTLEGDPELLGEFVSEAADHLDAADVHVLTLETQPHDEEAINAVFRAFHTIKGVAGFLALEDIQNLSHEAESLLDKARKGEMELEGAAIDVTFDAIDMMKRLMGHVEHSLATGEVLAGEEGLEGLLRRIAAAGAGEAVESKDEPCIKVAQGQKLGEVLVEMGHTTEEANERALGKQLEDPERVKLGEILVRLAVASKKDVDEALLRQKKDGSPLGETLVSFGVATKEDIEAALAKQQQQPQREKLGKILVREGDASAKDVAHVLRAQKEAARRQEGGVHVREMLKIDASRLDRLVDVIGELVISESMVSQSIEQEASMSTELDDQLGQLNKITRELQELSTSLKMVPVRATFQKMARIARDTAKKMNKKITFSMSGEGTEIDKTLVDKIGDPLIHMIRNAVDHGIEDDVEARLSAGKDEAGHVELRAFHKGGSIYIEVEDDGGGMDREVILAKAIERGLVSDGESLSDREVYNFLFEAGFSTAKRVTGISGRGVGLDVVRRNVEMLRGQVEIQASPGKGSVFSMRLPLTMAIIDGMVVRVGRQRYIIPILTIVRSVRPTDENVSTVLGRGEMLMLQGELIPLFRLHSAFGIPGAHEEITEALVVIVEDDGKRTGLVVDELLGQQQIVIKTLGGMLQGTAGVSGGAIMPDGRVGLILDVGSLVKLTADRQRDAGAVEGDEADDADGAVEGDEVCELIESPV